MINKCFRTFLIMLTALLVNTAIAGNSLPKQFDIEGYFGGINVQNQWVNINGILYPVSLGLTAYNSDGSTTSLLSIKPNARIGGSFTLSSDNKKSINKLWVLPELKDKTPPG